MLLDMYLTDVSALSSSTTVWIPITVNEMSYVFKAFNRCNLINWH